VFEFAAGKKNFCFPNKIIDDLRLFDAFNRCGTTLFEKNNATFSEPVFLAMLRDLAQKYSAPEGACSTAPPPWLQAVQDHIARHLHDKINLQELARLAGLDKYKFIRIFKHFLGLTPFEFIVFQRILKSQNMLKQGKPLAFTALDSGFYDQSTFTRYFRKYIGVTPGTYRAACNIIQDRA
jgi:AraC-like DNA-binding protein